MTANKPTASVSLDLDNQWSYMKTHGDDGWQTYPSYLDIVVPRVLEFLRQRQLHITFFVVGQDAALACNRDALASLANSGHEIGNHSFHHEPWLHLYSPQQIADELARAEDHIVSATNYQPIGFRGPGFSLSEDVLNVLCQRGYLYDASTFPTYIGPLARAYYFMSQGRQWTKSEREQRQKLFGGICDGFRPLKPYKWQLQTGELLEIPVSTMPIFKIPIHLSYILYLGSFAPALALQYFRTAVVLCRLTSTPLSLLLHPLDFLGKDDVSELSFFPAMQLEHQRKLELVSQALDIMLQHFQIRSMREHARELLSSPKLGKQKPRFANRDV
jgi:hypothetical protein